MKRPANLLLLTLLAVCLLSLWLGRSGRDSAERDDVGETLPVPAAATRAVAPADSPPSPPVHLAVLNGTSEAGLARDIGLAVALCGCVAERVGNAPRADLPHSLLVNRRLPAAVAARLAARLGGLPVIEERDLRTSEDAVLVLGGDYARVNRALALPRSP
jgi:hypothetical protein